MHRESFIDKLRMKRKKEKNTAPIMRDNGKVIERLKALDTYEEEGNFNTAKNNKFLILLW